VLRGGVLVGPKLIVIRGGEVNCEVAGFIAHPVCNVNLGGNQGTIIEMLENVAEDERSSSRSFLIQRFLTKGVRIITSSRMIEILIDGVKYLKNG
jgi:hypothetical protein